FYFGDYNPIKTQLACKLANIALCEDWLSFKDNHTSAAPLILPRLAIGLYGADDKSWHILEHFKNLPNELGSLSGGSNGAYFDVYITSNGQEAVLESDWQVNRY